MPSRFTACSIAASVCGVLGILLASKPTESRVSQDPAAPARAPGLEARESPIKLQKAFDDGVADVKIGLRNASSQEIEIRRVRGSCGCIRVGAVPKSIPPHGEIEIPFTLKLHGLSGAFTKRVFVSWGEPTAPELVIPIEGEVGPRLVVEPGFAFVKRAAPDEAATADVEVRAGGDISLNTLTATASVPGVRVETIADGAKMRLHVVAPAEVPRVRGTITLRLGKYERVIRLTDGSTDPLSPPFRPPGATASHGRPAGAAMFAVAFSGQDLGELEPCGCTQGMMGGLSRRPARVRAFTEPGVPLIPVSGGSLVAGRDPLDQLRLGTFTKALQTMGFAAMAPTRLELSLGAGLSSSTSPETVPLVAVDVDEESVGARGLRRMFRWEQEDTFFYVTGVSAPVGAKEVVPGLKFVDPRQALRELRGELPVFAPLVVLANVGEIEARDLARYAGSPTLVLYAGGWTDPGPEDVEEGVVAFAPFPATGKYVGLARLLGKGAEAGWTVEFRPVLSELPEDEAMSILRKEHLEDLREANVVASSAGNARFTPQALSGETRMPLADGATGKYIGSAACAACHPAANTAWQASSHARAMRVLRDAGTDADPNCVSCHVVGYGTGRGFVSEQETAHLASVGCEACHGPRADHVIKRSAPGKSGPEPKYPAGRSACTACHDAKHDPKFEYDSYWQRIVHGAK